MFNNNIYLEVDGVRYEGFTDIAVNSAIENFSSSFSFTTTVKETKQGKIINDIKLGQKAKVFIDKTLLITGFIEEIDKEVSSSSHSKTASGRDVGGDIIDSDIIQKSYNQRNFERLINLVLKDNGFSIEVINKVGILNLEANETIKTEQGQSIFDFLDKYAKKLQVLLKIDKNGNLNIIREDNDVVKNMLINNYTADTNILASRLKLSTIDRFNVIEVYSQGNNKTHSKLGISQKGKAVDTQIRTTRRKILTMNTASESKSLKALAEWNIQLRRAKGSRYTCTTLGFYSSNNTLWQPNTLVDIIDYDMEVQGTFLIQGVTFNQNLQGSFTNLDIVEQGSFSIGKINNRGNNFADDLIIY
jgi:prophage tail gpP-like protein